MRYCGLKFQEKDLAKMQEITSTLGGNISYAVAKNPTIYTVFLKERNEIFQIHQHESHEMGLFCVDFSINV